MSKIIYTMVFGALLFATTAKAQAPEIERPVCFSENVKLMLECFTNLYGAKPEETFWIMNDESGLRCNPPGHNDGGRAFGPAQYHRETFYRHARLMGENLEYKSCYDNVKLFTWVFANRTREKCEWTKYGNTYCSIVK